MQRNNSSAALTEKRKNPRFECSESRHCPVELGGDAGTGRLFNFSREGLSLESPKPLSKDELYQLQIDDFYSEKRIPCEVRVMWVQAQDEKKSCLCGARIVRMDPADKMDLLDVLYEDWKRKVLS